jgi:hypothetical protein
MSEIEMKVGAWYEQASGIRWHCFAEIPADSPAPFVCYNQDGDCVTVNEHGMYYTDGCDSVMDLVRHLPGCTGFDWQEPTIPAGWRRLADDEVLTMGDSYLLPNGMLDRVYSYAGSTVKATREAWSHPPTFPYACIRKIEEPKPEPKFKVGDVVYATKPKDVSLAPLWLPNMDKLEGEPLKVVSVDDDYPPTCECNSPLTDVNWSFRQDWLSKEPPAAQYRPFANDEEYAPHFDRKVLRDSIASPGAKGQYRIGAFDESKVWTTDGVQCTYAQMLKDGRKFADTNEPFGVKIN